MYLKKTEKETEIDWREGREKERKRECSHFKQKRKKDIRTHKG